MLKKLFRIYPIIVFELLCGKKDLTFKTGESLKEFFFFIFAPHFK